MTMRAWKSFRAASRASTSRVTGRSAALAGAAVEIQETAANAASQGRGLFGNSISYRPQAYDTSGDPKTGRFSSHAPEMPPHTDGFSDGVESDPI
jgi:hypothetical protein